MGCAAVIPSVDLAFLPIRASLRLFLRSLGRPLLPDVEDLLHAGTEMSLFAVRAALAGEELRLRRAGKLAIFETIRMHPCGKPRVLKMHVEDVTR